MTAFRDKVHAEQMAWKSRQLPHVREAGWWQGQRYDHILPRSASAQNLWEGLRDGGVRPIEPWLDENAAQLSPPVPRGPSSTGITGVPVPTHDDGLQ